MDEQRAPIYERNPMATDRIRELAHAILSECAVWYLLPQGETPEVKEQRVVSTLDVATDMLRAALADKTLIEANHDQIPTKLEELTHEKFSHAQLNVVALLESKLGYDPCSAIKESETLLAPMWEVYEMLANAEAELAAARQNEIWGFYENEAPIYTTREEAHELSQLMTVEEANGLVTKLMAARQDSERLREALDSIINICAPNSKRGNHPRLTKVFGKMYDIYSQAIHPKEYDDAMEAQREKAK